MKANKTEQLCVRMEKGLRAQLEKEAVKMGLDVTAYARLLLATHPKRKSFSKQ